MRNSPYFTEGENFLYLLKEDPAYTHDPMAEKEYTYNGMMWLWTSNDSAPKGKEEMQTYKPVTAISAGKPKKQGISTGFGHCITGFDTIFTPFSRKLTDEKP